MKFASFDDHLGFYNFMHSEVPDLAGIMYTLYKETIVQERIARVGYLCAETINSPLVAQEAEKKLLSDMKEFTEISDKVSNLIINVRIANSKLSR